MRGVGDGITRLRAVGADLRPCAVPQVLERYRAGGIAGVGWNSQRNSSTRSGDLARGEGRAAALSPYLDTLVR